MGVGAIASGIGSGLQAVQGIASGISGKGASNKLEQDMQGQNQLYTGMLQGGSNALSGLQKAGQQFANPNLANQVLGKAQGLGGQLSGIANQAAGQLGSVGGYSFDPLKGMLGQTMAEQAAFGDRARATATEQAALAGQQGTSALDAALASRGFSRNSGAAAAGLAQLGAQTQQGLVGLNRDLANQAGQAGLQAAQLDSQNALQFGGLASQYNLGYGQLKDQEAMQAAGLKSDALKTGFDALQGTYQNNYLNPGLQYAGLASGLAGQLTGIGAGGLQGNTDIRAKGLQSAGGGKGAGVGGGASGFQSLGSVLPGKPQATGGGSGIPGGNAVKYIP